LNTGKHHNSGNFSACRQLRLLFGLLAWLLSFSCLAQTSGQISFGTGFIVAPGHLVTANHVVQGRSKLFVGPVGANKVVPAQVIYADEKADLALLKAEVPGSALPITPWNEVPIGLEAFSIGFPQPRLQGVSRKITQGIVNGDRTESGDNGFFQFSAEIQKGNSGGPVLAPDGSVIGVVRGKLNALTVAERTKDMPQNVNYAIKSSTVLHFLRHAPVRIQINSLDPRIHYRAYEIYRRAADSVLLVVAR